MEVCTAMIRRSLHARAGRPVRRPALFGNYYFLDRFVVAVCTVLISFALILCAARTIGPEVTIDQYIDPIYGNMADESPQQLSRRAITFFPFDVNAPAHVQYLQLLRNFLAWKPLAGTLAGSGLVAIALEWRSSQR